MHGIIFNFQTKFVESTNRIVTPPFMFAHGRPRTVIAFVEDKEMQQAALDAGAEAAGGVDLIKQVHNWAKSGSLVGGT